MSETPNAPTVPPPSTVAAYSPGIDLPFVSSELAPCVPKTGLVHETLWWAGLESHTPAAYQLGSILAVLSYEAARRGYVIVGGRHVPTVWSALIGASGLGKSTAMYMQLELLQDLHTRLRYPHIETVVARVEGSFSGVATLLRDYYVTEANRTCAILETDEVTRVFDSHDDWPTFFTTTWDGRTYRRHLREDQRAGKTFVIPSPAFSAIFGTTTSNIQRAARPHHFGGGLFARVLWFYADSRVGGFRSRHHPRPLERQGVLDSWEDWSRTLDGFTLRGEPSVVELPAHVNDFLDDELLHAVDEGSATDTPMSGTFARLLQQACTVAGLYALSNSRRVITLDDMAPAVELVRQSLRYVESLLPYAIADRDYQLMVRARELLAVAGSEGLAQPDLRHKLGVGRAVFTATIQGLIDDEAVTQGTRPTGGRGRPRTWYWLTEHAPAPTMRVVKLG